jgi:hypothetical protein
MSKVSRFYCNTHSPATFRLVEQQVTELAANVEKVMTQVIVEFCQIMDVLYTVT